MTIEAAATITVTTETPEVKTAQSGKRWCSITGVSGHGDDKEWLRIAVFDDLAESLAPTVRKGDRLYCEGLLSVSRWTTREGEARTTLQIQAWKALKVGAGAIGRNRKRKAQRTGGTVNGDSGDPHHQLAEDAAIPS